MRKLLISVSAVIGQHAHTLLQYTHSAAWRTLRLQFSYCLPSIPKLTRPRSEGNGYSSIRTEEKEKKAEKEGAGYEKERQGLMLEKTILRLVGGCVHEVV